MTQAKRAACVIGWPAGHSRSPLIHNYWISKHKLDAEYRKEAVPPEQFADLVRNLAARGYVGANCTVPHKETALVLSQPDDRARAVGAANTLWLDGTTLRSTNTDVEGFLQNLDEAAPGWDRGIKNVLVLGAGGAAAGIVYGLLERKVPAIHVANRTLARAEKLRERFGPAVHPAPWDKIGALMKDAGLLVNATSLGMSGQPPLQISLLGSPVIADAVYVPLETPLLKSARAKGLRTADGLGMLLHQAVRGFELWFGVRPRVTKELRALVEADLAKH